MKGGSIENVDSNPTLGFEYEFNIGVFASVLNEQGERMFVSLTKGESFELLNSGKRYKLFGDTTVDPTFIQEPIRKQEPIKTKEEQEDKFILFNGITI